MIAPNLLMTAFEDEPASPAAREASPALGRFLDRASRRALRMAELATGQRDEAPDLVQDAMFGFVRHYADRDAAEWAPLFWDADIQGAIEKLEIAVQVSASDPDVGPAAKRNLALALYRRGWQSMRQGKANEAAGDFERATRDPSVLKGSEPLAFDFSYAVAQLDAGNATEAAKLFKSLAAAGRLA